MYIIINQLNPIKYDLTKDIKQLLDLPGSVIRYVSKTDRLVVIKF